MALGVRAFMAIMIVLLAVAPAFGQAPDPAAAWRALHDQAVAAHQAGQYGPGITLAEQALALARRTFGERHPDTLQSLDNLALLYQRQGRHGEAEPLYRQALQLRREVQGERHPDTLTSLNNLAFLYASQGRHGEAEPLYRQALQLRREVLGERHPATITSLNNLALLYASQGRHGEAEPLFRQALQLSREVLGERHPDTLGSLNNLAALYRSQGRHGEAEPLYRQALQLSREVQGERHPHTITSLNNLAGLYDRQGRHGEAEPLYRQALQLSREVLGPSHPDTLSVQLNYVGALVDLDRPAEAVRQLRAMEPRALTWLRQELFSTESERVRRQLALSQTTFQDVVLRLALHTQGSDALTLAGTVMLRWKQLQGEEEAYLAGLVRRSQDPRVVALGREVARLRAQLARLARAGQSDAAATALHDLEAKEAALGQVSRAYKDHLSVRTASLEEVRAVLPPNSGLLEIRQYQPFDFKTRQLGDARWAGLLLVGFDEPVLLDLGPVADTEKLLPALLRAGGSEEADAAARQLYAQLLAPLDGKIAPLERLYLAPDGVLNLVPFAEVRLPDGRRWIERQEIRLLQTGRDLLRPPPDYPARGLVGFGGIDFDTSVVTTVASAEPAAGPDPATTTDDLHTAQTRTREAIDKFKPLPASGAEIDAVAQWYRRLRKDETVQVWQGGEASESRLKTLAPPRVLHLATHGFYRAQADAADRPLVLSGIALAGANRGLATSGDEDGEDGVLYSIEAAGLDLEGTELTVLSACETGQGHVDYSEGVYGLVRALRIAGSRQVLMTLWPVNDDEAEAFMADFYRTWLSQTVDDPAQALRATQLSYATSPDPARNNPRRWAPYNLVGG